MCTNTNYKVIGSVQDKEDAVQRIYGHRHRAKADYPQETSLQQKALNKMNLLGNSCGIILRSNLL